MVHVRRARRRRDQRHVVEGGHQDAAVERPQVHEAIQVGVDGGRGLAAVARRRGAEPIVGADAQRLHVPRRAEFGDDCLHASHESLSQRDAAVIVLLRQFPAARVRGDKAFFFSTLPACAGPRAPGCARIRPR